MQKMWRTVVQEWAHKCESHGCAIPHPLTVHATQGQSSFAVPAKRAKLPWAWAAN